MRQVQWISCLLVQLLLGCSGDALTPYPLQRELQRSWVVASEPVDVRGMAGGRLRLEHATVADLVALPGIGPVLAERILTWQRARPIHSLDELLGIRGIGPARLAALAPYLAKPSARIGCRDMENQVRPTP